MSWERYANGSPWWALFRDGRQVACFNERSGRLYALDRRTMTWVRVEVETSASARGGR